MYLDRYGQDLLFNGNEIERLINEGLIGRASMEIFSEHIGVVNELIRLGYVYPIDMISSEGVRWVLDASPLRDIAYDLLYKLKRSKVFYVIGSAINKSSAFISGITLFRFKGLRIPTAPWLTKGHCAQIPVTIPGKGG